MSAATDALVHANELIDQALNAQDDGRHDEAEALLDEAERYLNASEALQ